MSEQQNQQTKPEASATTCIVGCKLPHGLILTLIANDGAKISHELKGTNANRIIGVNSSGVGFALTDGIPTDFMVEWLKRNEKHLAVQNGSIFMHNTEKGAMSIARERAKVRTGIEPINPMEDSRAAGLEVDKEAEKIYRKQMAENPVRNRQVVLD